METWKLVRVDKETDGLDYNGSHRKPDYCFSLKLSSLFCKDKPDKEFVWNLTAIKRKKVEFSFHLKS